MPEPFARRAGMARVLPDDVAAHVALGAATTVVYMARWITTRGEKGPWSEIATATVAA